MDRFIAAWTADPIVLVGLGLAAGLYARGWRRTCRQARRRSPPAWRACCYAAGLIVLGVALLSPIGTLDGALFALHMTQHLLLTLVAAPLLLLGAPLLPMVWGLPPAARRGVGRLVLVPRAPLHRLLGALSRPGVALPLYLVTLAVWHVPAFYDAAQGRTVVHDLEHGLFLGTALLFWWPVIHPSGGPRRLGYGLAVPYVVPAMLEGQLLGALLTFASAPLYATYRAAPRISALSALDDQQLAGLLMWIPSAMVYLAAILILVALFSREDERRQRAVEEREQHGLASDGRAVHLAAGPHA